MIKKTSLLISSVFSLFLLSGCTFFEEDSQELAPTYIELEGTVIDENDSSFALSEYFLVNEKNEKIASLESKRENLSLFVDKKVILKGEKVLTSLQKKGEKKPIMTLDIVQISALPEESKTISSSLLGFSLVLPLEFSGSQKDARFQVITAKTEDPFFTVFSQKNQDWKEKFLAKGERIVLEDFDVRRIYSGKRIQLYFPKNELQIDYWGEKNGEYDFYKILESLEFFEKTGILPSEEENNDKNSDKDSDVEKLDISGEASSSEISRGENRDENININSTLIVKRIEGEIQKNFGDTTRKVKKIALYKDFADVEISEKNTADQIEKKRIIYKISGDENTGFELEEVAKFTQGEVQSWELESGEIPNLTGSSEIFLGDVDDIQPIILPENFALYLSTHFDFQVGYPRSMYYGATGKNEDSLASVNWSSSPLTPENSEIRLEIKDGEISEEKILRDENTIIFPRDSKTHFKLSALHDNFNIVEEMKRNFRNEK